MRFGSSPMISGATPGVLLKASRSHARLCGVRWRDGMSWLAAPTRDAVLREGEHGLDDPLGLLLRLVVEQRY